MKRLLLFIVLCVGAAVRPAFAADVALPVGKDLETDGWRVLTLTGKSPTRFVARDGAIEIEAQSSVAFLYRPVPASARSPRYLSWQWRVLRDVPAADLSRAGADDRPLAVHVWFGPTEAERGFVAGVNDIVRSIVGVPRFGRLITYVWGGEGSRGQSFASPHESAKGGIVILRPTGTMLGEWQQERVDPRFDYQRLFGIEPPEFAYVAVSADTDDRGGHSLGQIAGLRLEL